MSVPIIFPDVELLLTGYLRTALAAHGYAGIHVSNTRGTHGTAVWVRGDGGPGRVVTAEPRVSVNVFAPTEKAVNDLARTVSALMRSAAGYAQVKRVSEPMGPTPITDAASPRRFMTYELVVKGTEL